MSGKAESWQTAEIAGPKKAFIIMKPEVITALLKRAKKPILIVGHLGTEKETEYATMIDYAIRLVKAFKLPIVTTAHTAKEFVSKGLLPDASMSAMDIGNRLQDQTWKGLDGQGPYDLALFLGLPYYMEFVILSSLKHFSKNIKTISLNRFYNPHATWSFPNLSVKKWDENIEKILINLEKNEKKI